MKLYNFVLSLFVLTNLTSCYEDYYGDNDYNAVSFSNTCDVRTFVVGENSEIKVGVVLSGVLENKEKRIVEYEFDETLLSDETLQALKNNDYEFIRKSVEGVEGLKMLPEDWFTISDTEKFTINKGNFAGILTVKINWDKFLSKPDETRIAQYSLPFKIISADADSIVSTLNTSVVAFKYDAKLFGNYYNYGARTTYDRNNLEVSREVVPFYLPMPDNTICSLTTTSPNTLLASKVGNVDGQMYITLNEDNTVTLEEVEGSDFEIEEIDCRYNNPKLLQDRKLFLNYKVHKNDGGYVYVTDTLAFRDRVRDCVNEWRDENPENYK